MPTSLLSPTAPCSFLRINVHSEHWTTLCRKSAKIRAKCWMKSAVRWWTRASMSSANYFGLMNPTPTYVAVLSEALVAALNPQLDTLARSQLASKIELETVRWIGERVGWPGAFNGTFTSGGNEANFSGLALALAAKFPESIDDGIAMIGAKPVAYSSAESHHSLDKSAGLLGIGRKALRRVAVNVNAQLDPGKLEKVISEDLAAERIAFCVVATAGTTNSGTVDDLVAISEVCCRHNLWLHVA